MNINPTNKNQNFGYILSSNLYNKLRGNPWNINCNIYHNLQTLKDRGSDRLLLDLDKNNAVKIIYPKFNKEFTSGKTFANNAFKTLLKNLDLDENKFIREILSEKSKNDISNNIANELLADMPHRKNDILKTIRKTNTNSSENKFALKLNKIFEKSLQTLKKLAS